MFFGKKDDLFMVSLHRGFLRGAFFEAYLITDERYKKLGSLIPLVVVPSSGMLYQTTKGEKGLFDFVDRVKPELEKLFSIRKRIEELERTGQ
jgi:hypothetical protein